MLLFDLSRKGRPNYHSRRAHTILCFPIAMDVSKDSSSAVGTYDYDVFLSFNGSSRPYMADDLYRILQGRGIRVFESQKLSVGEDVSSSLRRAIKRSRISIPIISDNYAENAQCLDEVVQMLKCRESQGQRIFPIYCRFDPHDIRNQMSPFRCSFTKHEREGIDTDRIEIWKKALRQVASLKAWEVGYCSLADVKRIASYVLQSLKEFNSSATVDASGVSPLVEGILDYDVFLNFVPDVKIDFADLLYRRLTDAGVLVVRGEDVPVGEEMVDFVPQVMKRSKISIPVFSKVDGGRRWFLDEVAGMVECRKSQGHKIFPIYYQIDPNDIRYISYCEGVNPHRMEIWKQALRKVESLKGWKLNKRSGDKLIEHIISHVRQSLREGISSTPVNVPVGSSLVKGTYDYDVFLSFGSDIERNFASTFYNRLKDARILVFRVEDIPVGEEIAAAALQAMNRTKISIPIFSKGYAGSEQCLDVVLGMVECRKSQRHRVFPIYYHIDPEDIRNRMGKFGYVFTSDNREADHGRIEIRKRALREVLSLKGWELGKRSGDVRVEHIISHVRQSLREEISSTPMNVPVGSSLVKGTYDYDVFLSFGSDIKRNFASTFYNRLKDARILVFRVEDIPVGEEIVAVALQAMNRSKISIPIFSKGYAGSQQCLDVVVGMVECRKSQRHRVFPIYYQIDPEDIRNQMGEFGYILTSDDREADHGRIEIWEQALSEVASLKGWELDKPFQDGVIESIISHVLQSLKEDTSSITMDVSEGSSNSVDRIPDYDVFLNFGSSTRRGFANILYHRLKDAGVLVFRDEDIAVGEEMVDLAEQVIKRSRISIPVFSNDYARRQQRLHEVVLMLECRKSQGHRVFPIYYEIDPCSLTDRVCYILFELSFGRHRRGEMDYNKFLMWKQAFVEIASLERWEPDHKSIDDTVESIVSKVRQVLNGDGLNGGNAGTSATPFEAVLSSSIHEKVATSFYKHMKDAGIRVFGFDELPVEEEDIDKEFVRAINNSDICIPFLTEDYLASAQCLRQLTQIMESRKNIPGQLVIPVFYDIEPPDEKLETDSYINALKEHEQNFPTEVSRWKEALREVAELQGWRFKAASFKRYSKSVVIAVLNKLKEKNHNVLVGMQEQLEKLKEVLDVESQDVRIVGIYGIGGIGKTTLARAIFDQLSIHFEGCSFIRDIRETSKCKGVKYLQQKLLRDITCADIGCETKTARHVFLEKKVLIVLDDVDEREQIKKLIGKSNWFISGSRIIVTTKDINVLAVERETLDGRILEWPEEVRPFKMKEMEYTEALQLFSYHAFGNVSPPDEYIRTCEEVVYAIGRLPLALEIIGSFLNHKPTSILMATLDKLKNLPDQKLHTKLMISYESLEHETKEVFLDIACFFIGQEKTTPIYMWDACELLPELGIEALSFLSLVKISSDNRLWMHDEVRDLGRKTVCGGFTMDSTKYSQLWVNEQVLDILRNKEVNENAQCLRLCFNEFLLDYTLPPEELGSLPNLRFVELLGLPFAMKNALPKLRWLSWHHCPQHVETSDLYLENLVILDLSNSYVSDQLGESGLLEMAKHLKILDLTNCRRITRTPIFSDCMILERLILEGCENLGKIDSSIGKLKQLLFLNLKGCYSLKELPKELGSAMALTELLMKGNGQSFKLQESIACLTSLSVLEIENVEIVDSVHIGNSKGLERLILSKCSRINKLTESGQFFSLLVKLDLSGSEITQLPDSIGEMKNLRVINMESSLICELPKSIGNLKKLEELQAKKCRGLSGEIPDEIGALYSLQILDLSYTRISSFPTTLSKLSNLQTLNLEFCIELENLPVLPKSLINLHIMSKKLRNLPDLSKMTCLRDLRLFCPIDKFQTDWINKLSRLEKLGLCIPTVSVLELGDAPHLRYLSISCKEMRTLAQLPSTLSSLCLAHLKKNTRLPSLCNLKSLIFIDLYNCSIGDDEFRSLGALKPISLEHLSARKCDFSMDNGLPLLERLRVLSLKDCKLPRLLDLQRLKNLVHLDLTGCQLLIEITGLEKLESLEEIIISNCNSLETLGDLSDLQNLEVFQIDCCEMLMEVKGLERLNTLKYLEICRCKLDESFPDSLKRSREVRTGSASEEKKLRTG